MQPISGGAVKNRTCDSHADDSIPPFADVSVQEDVQMVGSGSIEFQAVHTAAGGLNFQSHDSLRCIIRSVQDS